MFINISPTKWPESMESVGGILLLLLLFKRLFGKPSKKLVNDIKNGLEKWV